MESNERTENGSPLFQEDDVAAAHNAGELFRHLEQIKALNWEPKTNRREIAWHTEEARAALDALNAHFALNVASIAAVKPATTVRCYCGNCEDDK